MKRPIPLRRGQFRQQQRVIPLRMGEEIGHGRKPRPVRKQRQVPVGNQLRHFRQRQPKRGNIAPTLRGVQDPFVKRNWIYSQLGPKRMIRDWSYLLYADGPFHGINYDPWQQVDMLVIKHNDKLVKGEHKRLSHLMSRFPKSDAPGPFEAYRKRYAPDAKSP